MTHTVMLIEDDETMRSLIQALLEIEGFSVAVPQQVNALETVLGEVRKAMPDLLLLDVNLRDLSGFDLLRLIRQDNDLKNIHVILSSGMEVGHESLQLGADDFLLKPFMPDELVSKIRKNLEN